MYVRKYYGVAIHQDKKNCYLLSKCIYFDGVCRIWLKKKEKKLHGFCIGDMRKVVCWHLLVIINCVVACLYKYNRIRANKNMGKMNQIKLTNTKCNAIWFSSWIMKWLSNWTMNFVTQNEIHKLMKWVVYVKIILIYLLKFMEVGKSQ